MNKDDFIKMMEDGYKLLTREETLEEKSFRVGYEYAVDKMFYIVKNSDKEIENLHKIIDGMIDNEEEYCIENNNLKERIDKTIEYITSEETINMFSSINAREKWLKINHKLLNILKGDEK